MSDVSTGRNHVAKVSRAADKHTARHKETGLAMSSQSLAVTEEMEKCK